MRFFQKTLNVRLLAVLLVSALLGGAALHGLHQFQVRRQAGFFLEQARQAEKAGEFSQALSHFRRYLSLHPGEFEALKELGFLQARIGDIEWNRGHHDAAGSSYLRADRSLEKLLRLPRDSLDDPSQARSQARRRLVEVALKLGRFSDAAEHLEDHLLKKSKKDIELLRLLALCQINMGDYQAADRTLEATIESLKESVQVAPEQFQVYDARSQLLRERLNAPKKADRLMDEMVDDHPHSAPARVVRAYYLYRRANNEADPATRKALVEGANRDAEAALVLDSENTDAHKLKALYCIQVKQLDQAREHARRGVELAPQQPGVHLLLAEVEQAAGRFDDAVAATQHGLAEVPENQQQPLLWKLANLSLNLRDLEQAQQATQKLIALGYSKARTEYLQGGIAFGEARKAGSGGDWAAVQQELNTIRLELASSQDLPTQALGAQVDYWLGESYGRLRQPDLQRAFYRKAFEANPSWTLPRIALAGALAAAGKTEEALKEYALLEEAGNVPPSVLLDSARLLVWQNSRVKPADRDYPRVDHLLNRVEKADPDSVDVVIFRAESLGQQARLDDAEKVLTAARDKQPEEVRIWAALIALEGIQETASEDRDGLERHHSAAKLLAEAEAKFGDMVTLRIARARYLARQLQRSTAEESRKPLESQLKQLAADTDGFSVADQLRLWEFLLIVWRQADDPEQAKYFCRLISEARPRNLAIRLTMLDIIRREQAPTAAEHVLAEVRQIVDEIDGIENSGPRWHYAQAVRLRLAAGQDTEMTSQGAEMTSQDAEMLNNALQHLSEAEKSLPRWSSPPLLAGEIHDLLGQKDAALGSYANAIQLGSADLLALERASRLLNERGSYAEADRLLGIVESLAESRGHQLPIEMGQQQAESFLRAGEFERALEKAKSVAAESDDYHDHLWLAQVLTTVAQPRPTERPSEETQGLLREAEQSLRRAIELAPEEYRSWAAMIQFLKATGRIQEVQETLEEAQREIQDPAMLAKLYQGIGELSEAIKTYQAELAHAPDDPVNTLRLIDAYGRAGSADLAEPLLRKILAGEVKVEAATLAKVRRRLAEILRVRGGYLNLNQAVRLIRDNLDDNTSSPADQRALANLLALLPEFQMRSEAIDLLEELVKIDSLPSDQFLLARLYSTTEGNWSKSRKQMLSLLGTQGSNPQYVAAYVEALLDRKETSDAELWLRKLEQLSPSSLVTRNLRARMFVEEEKFDQAIAYLTEPLGPLDLDPSRREVLLSTLAPQLEHLARLASENGQPAGAEQLAANAKTIYQEYAETGPGRSLPLASFLRRQGRPAEGLELLEGAAFEEDSLILADFQTALEHYDQVEALYREVLAKDGNNVIALNNLAVLLALEAKHSDEALQLVNRAIKWGGAGPVMLDSRATVYLAAKKPEKALADIEAALKDPPTSTRLFHLAQIKRRLNDLVGARQAFEEADKLNLQADQLHPLERAGYRDLNARLTAPL